MHEQLLAHDGERDAAFDVLLLLADSHADDKSYRRALDLLDHAEHAAGGLPPEYELKRLRWLLGA